MTTQNVAWPSTIVQTLNGIPARLNAERSEIPVKIPGSAIGRMIISEIDSRPKKRVRDIAAAARLPSSIAINVDNEATRRDNESASQMSCRPHATANQRSVKPGGGNS